MIKEKIISNLEIYAETYNKATELWENVRNQIMRENPFITKLIFCRTKRIE